MAPRIGIRREDKSKWERRVPIIPEHVHRLQTQHGIEVWVQPSETRVFPDEAYREASARLTENLSPCPVVFAVKEIPSDLFRPGHTYVFFAHVIKGQPYNMPMLQSLLDRGCQLIDYEKITDRNGRRLIFFGRHAGLAGMIDTLWALGQRLDWEGIPNPFSDVQQTHMYDDLQEARSAISVLGNRIAQRELPESLAPLICGFAGYGNVYRGANEIVELLPVQEIEPHEVEALAQSSAARDRVYKVVFKEEHTVEPKPPHGSFDRQEYYEHPEMYRSKFDTYLPHLTLLINCVYWEEAYPRLVTKSALRKLYDAVDQPRLRVIGDISCDMEGAIEATVEATEPDAPVYVYDPFQDRVISGVEGHGPVVLAVDILPSELPRDASRHFSSALIDYVPAIARADYSLPFDQLDLPPELKRALVVHQGRLTPQFRYLREHLR